MPSAVRSKRSRRAAFADDDDEGVTIAQGSSSQRSESHRRKVRVSDGAPGKKSARSQQARSSTSPDSDADQNNEEAETDDVAMEGAGETGSPPPPATQYEMLRDAGFRHLEHEEEDDQRATQRLRTRSQATLGDNRAAPNAVLESITCINFMCHIRLHCELGPLLNFIVGENGSGKSAVLTAITLCLGGKASSTNRGGSLRSFVKEGQEHASLIVKIKNGGVDAYKHDLYGDSITVERWFTKSGSSGFKLKTDAGRIISTKKSDVDDVVEYYCLQVDNPLNILSQDNARQFLNAASPAAKYKYFVQGTQLEQLDNDYQLLTELLDANEVKLQEYNDTVAYKKREMDKAVKLKETIDKNAELRARYRLYANQMAWAQVQEQEEILQAKEKAIADHEVEITDAAEAIAAGDGELRKIDEKVIQASANLESLSAEEEKLKETEDEAKDKYNNGKKGLELLHIQERDVHGTLQNARTNLKNYERKIREEEQRLEEVNGGALAEKQKELEDAKQARNDAEDALKRHTAEMPSLAEAFVKAEQDVQQSGGTIDEKRKEVQGAESRLRALSSNRTDPLAAYEPPVAQLVRLIENDTSFAQKPVGPIGSLIQLTNPAWGSILEKTLGNTLNAFVVSNRADAQRLSHHMDRLRIRRCPVIVGPQRPLENLKEPEENFDTVLRVLNFDHRIVRDVLVIENRIEQLLLIEDRSQAQRVMFDGRPPDNVAACLALHDKKRGFGLRLTAGRNGNLGTTTVNPDFNQKPRIQSDSEAQVDIQRDTLGQLQGELSELENERRRLQQAATKCSRDVTAHKKAADKLEADFRRAEAKVDNIAAEFDKFEGVDSRLQGLRSEVEEAQKNVDHNGNQWGMLVAQKQERNREVEALKQEVIEAKQEMVDFRARKAKAEDKLKRYEEGRRLVLVEKNKAHEDQDMARMRKTQAEESRDRQIARVEEYSGKASVVCAERAFIPEGESFASITRKYESIKEQLEKSRRRMGASDEEINNRAEQAIQAHEDARRHLQNAKLLLQELKISLNSRLNKWRMFQRMISAHARTNFGFLLSERGFRGLLKLDHERKKLEIKVEPDETRQNVSGRNTKTLSGGEKSFSSICLLLAIWEAMGSPLRCLDEFDVFMDQVNRAISTNMLITAARRSVGKQFILITPNAIEGRASLDKDVKIIRLTDPRQRLLADH